MIKSYVFLYLLFTLYMITIISCESAEVVWDDGKDVIYYDGKLYFSSDNKNAINNTFNNNHVGESSNSDSNENMNNGVKNKLPENLAGGHEANEEELVSGGKFWFCIFMILGNFV